VGGERLAEMRAEDERLGREEQGGYLRGISLLSYFL